MKYSWEFKLECVEKYKNGEYIATPGKTRNQRKTFLNQVNKWTKNYDDLGINGLKHSSTNKIWTPEKRFELVAEVLAGHSISSVAKNAHIDSGQLYQWVRKYSEKGIDGFRERNEYLEMENEYLKKLDALVSKREAAEAKAKKQK